MKIKLTTIAIKSTDANSAAIPFYDSGEFTSYINATYGETNKIENKQVINDTIEIESKQHSRRTSTVTFVSDEAWEEYRNDNNVKNHQQLRKVYNQEKGIRSQTIIESLVETPI